MENNDQSHNRDRDDQGQRKVGVDPCTPSSSQELAVAAVAPPSKAEFPLENSPGLRFIPTDEELILYYLKPKVAGDPIPASNFFADVDLYKFDPRTLIENRMGAGIDGDEWYFFTLRDRKYRNGSRWNRCTPSGVWKSSRKGSVILAENRTIGYKTSLAFVGNDSKRRRDGTDLNMHEYKLEEDKKGDRTSIDGKKLDEWVLCKVYTPRRAKQSKNQSRKKAISHLQSAPNHKVNTSQQVDAVHNHQPLQSSQISAPNHELNTSQQVDAVNNLGLHQGSRISVHLHVPRVVPQVDTVNNGLHSGLSAMGSSCICTFHGWSHRPRVSGLLFGSSLAILLLHRIRAEALPFWCITWTISSAPTHIIRRRIIGDHYASKLL
ncbi:NAC domain-containing protein 1-like [Eucalyptus grandis]|uniref:NAC domain-containing protein 1-like n=1 Tax=Eucalyptus grandis TaxID=71139 RepID=UPI00192ED720|nr:NAC domain-containing protein 1-like [Eucalyptus grandis]